MIQEDPPAAPGGTNASVAGTVRIDPGDVVGFHRVMGCDETWSLIEGGPLELHLIHADGRHEWLVLSAGSVPAGRAAATIEAGSLRAARLAPEGCPATVRRSVGTGESAPSLEIPSAAEILRKHPLHRSIVIELTAG